MKQLALVSALAFVLLAGVTSPASAQFQGPFCMSNFATGTDAFVSYTFFVETTGGGQFIGTGIRSDANLALGPGSPITKTPVSMSGFVAGTSAEVGLINHFPAGPTFVGLTVNLTTGASTGTECSLAGSCSSGFSVTLAPDSCVP